MLLRVIAVGTKMPAWVDDAVDTFSRRMPPELRIDWKPVRAEPRESGGSASQWREREAQRIREALPRPLGAESRELHLNVTRIELGKMKK